MKKEMKAQEPTILQKSFPIILCNITNSHIILTKIPKLWYNEEEKSTKKDGST